MDCIISDRQALCHGCVNYSRCTLIAVASFIASTNRKRSPLISPDISVHVYFQYVCRCSECMFTVSKGSEQCLLVSSLLVYHASDSSRICSTIVSASVNSEAINVRHHFQFAIETSSKPRANYARQPEVQQNSGLWPACQISARGCRS